MAKSDARLAEVTHCASFQGLRKENDDHHHQATLGKHGLGWRWEQRLISSSVLSSSSSAVLHRSHALQIQTFGTQPNDCEEAFPTSLVILTLQQQMMIADLHP